MNLRLQFDITDIDWDLVVEILRIAGMAYYSPERHMKAFANSHHVVFVFEISFDELLITWGSE